ncbi:hypothetical protein LTR36_007659 [Oleoguttula mirabilis]|uniref:DUF155 domain-containing protein n=1 Tax=Oleoguttula mirabilis TaxID=1507867 RepID=A0AAV9JVW6_9PEZI|nr:hypothetical protein LTR36_007659 [Oleoguttula mirabilis]
MASRVQTWLAFRSIVKRSLSCPQRQPFHHPHQTITSHATKGRNTLAGNHFSSTRATPQDEPEPAKADPAEKETGDNAKPTKRKAARTQASSTSLRRVAVEAQRSRKVIKGSGKRAHVDPDIATKDVTAYCAAETYNLHVARHVLRQEGYEPDPIHTDLFPQVLHVQTPNFLVKSDATGEAEAQGLGDVFVFPSGSVVTWNVSEKLAHTIVQRILPEAAEKGHLDKLEVEDMEYVEDPTREHSKIVGDTIILGTKASTSSSNSNSTTSSTDPTSPPAEDDSSASTTTIPRRSSEIDTILAKIAFSSALARSTKLAVLEEMLSAYFSTTRSIPTTLSAGARLRYSRAFILRKTGELLHIRAQLNLYSELTDSLPDLFWDYRTEMGLESYYEQVGRALDVGVRIKVLNERMDYASEIAAVLRERLSERHSTELEWLIIVLISIEVGFEIRRLWKERQERLDSESTEALMRRYLKKELGG